MVGRARAVRGRGHRVHRVAADRRARLRSRQRARRPRQDRRAARARCSLPCSRPGSCGCATTSTNGWPTPRPRTTARTRKRAPDRARDRHQDGGCGPATGQRPSARPHAVVSQSRQVQRVMGPLVVTGSRRSPARTLPASVGELFLLVGGQGVQRAADQVDAAAGHPRGRPAAGCGEPDGGGPPVGSRHPTDVSGLLEPVDEPDRPRVRDAEYLAQEVDARVRRQDVHQRGQGDPVRDCLAGDVLGRVGHPVGQGEGQRAEDVGRASGVVRGRRGGHRTCPPAPAS